MAMINLADNLEILVGDSERFEMVVTGRSMLPLLGFGRDSIVMRRVGIEEPILNRIAMFRVPSGKIIVHRVIDVANDVVSLRGDGNLYQIEKCRRDEIIAVLEQVVRHSGKRVSCTTRLWRFRERMWLCQPLIVRRYALAVMHRWLNFRDKKR